MLANPMLWWESDVIWQKQEGYRHHRLTFSAVYASQEAIMVNNDYRLFLTMNVEYDYHSLLLLTIL